MARKKPMGVALKNNAVDTASVDSENITDTEPNVLGFSRKEYVLANKSTRDEYYLRAMSWLNERKFSHKFFARVKDSISSGIIVASLMRVLIYLVMVLIAAFEILIFAYAISSFALNLIEMSGVAAGGLNNAGLAIWVYAPIAMLVIGCGFILLWLIKNTIKKLSAWAREQSRMYRVRAIVSMTFGLDAREVKKQARAKRKAQKAKASPEAAKAKVDAQAEQDVKSDKIL